MKPDSKTSKDLKRLKALATQIENELNKQYGINWASVRTTLDALEMTAGHVKTSVEGEIAKAKGQQSLF